VSVYPKRNAPGDKIGLHNRVKLTKPGKPTIVTNVFDPFGRSVYSREFAPTIFPTSLSSENAVTAATNNKVEIERVHSVYLTARHLIGNDGNFNAMVSNLRKLGSSVHFHEFMELSLDCEPGKYTVKTHMYFNGDVVASDTVGDDFFYVDCLRACLLETDGSQTSIEVTNLGSEIVPARIILLRNEQTFAKRLAFGPGKTTIENIEGQATLVYCEGRKVISLIQAGSAVFVRNHRLPWTECKTTSDILIYAEQGSVGWKLNGTARELWLSADGVSEVVINRFEGSIVNQMLADCLVYKV
jgi:hypothetical protein